MQKVKEKKIHKVEVKLKEERRKNQQANEQRIALVHFSQKICFPFLSFAICRMVNRIVEKKFFVRPFVHRLHRSHNRHSVFIFFVVFRLKDFEYVLCSVHLNT